MKKPSKKTVFIIAVAIPMAAAVLVLRKLMRRRKAKNYAYR